MVFICVNGSNCFLEDIVRGIIFALWIPVLNYDGTLFVPQPCPGADLGFFNRKSRFKIFDKIFKLADGIFIVLAHIWARHHAQENNPKFT